MIKTPAIPAKDLHKILDYDPETGLFKWKHRPLEFFKDRGDQARWNTRLAGKPALNADDTHGYKRGAIFNRNVKAHQVAWAMHYGEWPERSIDHLNSDRADNRIENLRIAAHKDNQRNQKRRRDNASGHTGVYKVGKKWVAKIKVDYKSITLGTFEDINDAIAARKAAEVEYNFHPNHGRK